MKNDNLDPGTAIKDNIILTRDLVQEIILTESGSSDDLKINSVNIGNNFDISSIEDGAFDGLNLQKIIIRYLPKLLDFGGRFTKLTKKTFGDCSKLQELHIILTQLNTIEDGTFESMSNLESLILRENELSYVTKNVFLGLINLKLLYITCWSFEELFVENKPFEKLENLEKLLLFGIKSIGREYINPQTFSSLKKLKTLHLDWRRGIDNNYYKIKLDFAELKLLEVLFLIDLRIDEIEENTFATLHNLKTLHYTGNKLKKISKNYFKQTTAIEILNLEYNQIEEIEEGAFEGLGKLRVLDLSSNRLKKLKKGMFMGLGALEYLDLCGNKINEIEEGTFEGLESLKTLRLLNNIDDIFSPRNISEDVVTRIKEELALINNLICEIEF